MRSPLQPATVVAGERREDRPGPPGRRRPDGGRHRGLSPRRRTPRGAWPRPRSRGWCEMSSALVPANASFTLSITASAESRKRADVPGVTFSLTLSMKSSSMPASASEPPSAPRAAPTASPSSGTKKRMPNSRPQKAPPSAPAPVRLFSWRVFGLLLARQPLDRGGVEDRDQLLLGQPDDDLLGLRRAFRAVELPCGQRGHRAPWLSGVVRGGGGAAAPIEPPGNRAR